MKIAILGTRGYPYVYSGYETFVKELCERLVQRDFFVTIYCHKNLFDEHPEEVNGIRLKYFRSIQKKSLSQILHTFQSMLHACFCDYDVVLVVNPSNGIFGFFSKLFGKKTIMNTDGLEWLRPKWKGLGAKYYKLGAFLSTKLYDELVADSEGMRKVYLEMFDRDSTVIEYGANIRESINPDLIKEWNLKTNGYYLVVGRLIPDNNSDIIVREFSQSDSSKKLVIVGDVPYKDKFAEDIKKNASDKVIFTGYVKDQEILAELYHNSFAYFHGHEFGGTNPTLLKALAYGCGIIALDTRFSREVLNSDKHGLYFSKKNGNLSSLIEKVEGNEEPILKMKAISRDRIRERYTWEIITEKYVQLFERMLNK